MPNTAPEILDYAREPRSRLGSRSRMFLTLFDQGVVSLATFLTGVLISRASKEGAGLYVLVFTLWVLGGEVHNSLVSTPQMLRLPRLSARRARPFNGSLLVHQFGLSFLMLVVLLTASAALYGIGRHDDALVTLLAGVSIGPLAFRNFARNHCLSTRDVPSAITLDTCVSLLQLGGVAILFYHGDLHRWWLAVLIVAAANLFSALLWLSMARRQFELRWDRVWPHLRRNWSTSRFIFASSMVWFAGMYFYPWMIKIVAGVEQAGVWFVCFALASLGNPLVIGVQNFIGPAIAHAHAERDAAGFRRYVIVSTFAFTGIVLPACIVMAALAEFLLVRLNGPQYAGNGVVTAILVFTVLLQGISYPTSRGLFSLNRAGLDMLANVPPILVLGAAGVFFISRYGVMGAAITLIIAQTLGSATRLGLFLWASRPPASRPPMRLADTITEAA